MKVVQFDGPANYEITIRGTLMEKFLSIVEKAKITTVIEGEELKSIISFKAKDQSHLYSILNTLYVDHYVILKVEAKTAADQQDNLGI